MFLHRNFHFWLIGRSYDGYVLRECFRRGVICLPICLSFVLSFVGILCAIKCANLFQVIYFFRALGYSYVFSWWHLYFLSSFLWKLVITCRGFLHYSSSFNQIFNFEKSLTIVNLNIAKGAQKDINDVFGLTVAYVYDKYLGLPSIVGRHNMISFIGWKLNFI